MIAVRSGSTDERGFALSPRAGGAGRPHRAGRRRELDVYRIVATGVVTAGGDTVATRTAGTAAAVNMGPVPPSSIRAGFTRPAPPPRTWSSFPAPGIRANRRAESSGRLPGGRPAQPPLDGIPVGRPDLPGRSPDVTLRSDAAGAP